MIKKILIVTVKIIVGIFAFYLFLALLIVPLLTPWVISRQGSKLLRHTMTVKSVFFNPFLLRLSVNGLTIMDDQGNLMIGFDKFGVDISFLRLFKKEYRVESVALDGINANAVLLADGTVNLMALAPVDSQNPDKATSGQKEAPKTPSADQNVGSKSDSQEPLPLVYIDKFSLTNGRIHFIDTTITPQFSTTINQMKLIVTEFSTEPGHQTKIAFSAMLDEKGAVSLEAQIVPLADPLKADTMLTLNSYALTILTPYVGKYTGRAVGEGKMDLRIDYRIENNTLTASHRLLVQNFDFGKKTESPDALNLPFGLAVALLEDPQGKISISLPVNGNMSDPQFHYWHLVGQVARNFFMKLITKPFSILASVIAGGESETEELGYVSFTPGQSVLSDDEKHKLDALIQGLTERPKLRLEVNGSYDPDVDWKAIKTDVFYKEFKALKKEFPQSDSPVYQNLYQRSFGIRALWTINNSYRLTDGKIDEDKLNEEMKRRLIESAPADRMALDLLAQSRAQTVYDYILASGFDKARIFIGPHRPSQSSMGVVPMEFTLTVLSGEKDINGSTLNEQAPPNP